MNIKSKISALVLTAILTQGATALAGEDHAHGDDFIIGRTDSGQLAAEFDTGDIHELPIVLTIPGDGFGADEPGFTVLDEDEPDEDFFMLGASAEISVELVNMDADLQVLSEPLFDTLLATPGDQWAMPVGNVFDVHPFWFVSDPDFSELGETFAFQFKLVDGSGTYTDSPVYTTNFIAVPEPTSLALAVLGGVMVVRRRRS